MIIFHVVIYLWNFVIRLEVIVGRSPIVERVQDSVSIGHSQCSRSFLNSWWNDNSLMGIYIEVSIQMNDRPATWRVMRDHAHAAAEETVEEDDSF